MKKYQYLASWDDQTLTRVGEPVVVLGDSNVSQVEVILPSNFLLDPTGAVARMYFLLPGEKESGFETLETATKDENGDSHVTWTIRHVHSQKGGRLAFSLTLIGDDAQWDSRTAIIPVYESRYQPESEEAEEPYTGRLTALEGSMASIRGEFAEVQDDFEELKETATLGTPIPESLVANMQEGHVYIYTGTETGYTAGHVYYYVGGALTDGGVYGGTAVDATLTQSGQAADAKKTGDEISAIKEDLSGLKEYNAYDILRDAPYPYENKTQYGVTWQWDAQNKVCTVSGTSTQMSRNRFFVDPNNLHSSIVPGKKYYIKYQSTGTAPALYIAWYANGSVTTYKYYKADAVIEVPSDTTGCIISLQIPAGVSVDGTVSVQMLSSKSNDELSEGINTLAEQFSDRKFYGIDFAPMYFDFSTVTNNGVSFTWDATKRTCKVSGTATPATANDILCSGKLPEGMNEGDKFLIRFKLDKIQSIAVAIYFYDGNGNILLDKYSSLHKIGNASADIPFEVPAGSATWRIKLYVPYRASDPITVDATVTRLQLFKTTPRKMEVPLIVSFIDDDTTNDTYVTRYHDSCCHNGITGNYAVITDRIGDTTSLAKLLQYEDEGFGMLIHAKDQNPIRTPYWSPKDEQGNPRAHTTEEINLCRANLCAGLRKMREDGFVNFNYWVTPGGHHEDEIIEMAKQLGLECMIPTNNFRYNSMQDCTKWIIRRISLDNTTQSGAAENLQFVKDKIDEAVADGGGWLIITTHYNEGWSSTDTWDDTLDSNGYPVGYERFNEIAQYAISAGMVPMTIPQAWEYYRIIIEANHSEYQRTIT